MILYVSHEGENRELDDLIKKQLEALNVEFLGGGNIDGEIIMYFMVGHVPGVYTPKNVPPGSNTSAECIGDCDCCLKKCYNNSLETECKDST